MTLHGFQVECSSQAARRISLDKTDDGVQSSRKDSSQQVIQRIHSVNRFPSWSSTEKDVTTTVVTLNTMDSTTVASQDSRHPHDSTRRRAATRDEYPLPQEVSIAPKVGASSTKMESWRCDNQIQGEWNE